MEDILHPEHFDSQSRMVPMDNGIACIFPLPQICIFKHQSDTGKAEREYFEGAKPCSLRDLLDT